MDDYIKTALSEAFEKRKCRIIPTGGTTERVEVTTPDKALDELYEHIRQNTWLEYFLKCDSLVGENWIDFESEISRVIQYLDELKTVIRKNKTIQEMHQEKQKILKNILYISEGSLKKDYESIKGIENFVKFLNKELERLIRALEIYIAEFVSRISISHKNSDIESLTIGHVLSFDYSNTYKKCMGQMIRLNMIIFME